MFPSHDRAVRGASAAADFAVNKTITLPRVLGRALGIAGSPTLTSTFTTDFMSNNELLTLSATGFITTGTKVQFTTTGTLPTGLSLATDYYVEVQSSTTLVVATSTANIIAGTYVTLSSDGTGTHTLNIQYTPRALGEYLGEEEHLLAVSEMPAHNHDIEPYDDMGGAQGMTVRNDGTNTGNYPTVIQDTGGSSAHNNMQPTSFMNVMIKL